MKDKISIREYANRDKLAVLDLLRRNTPAYFSPEEEKDLVHYLDHEIEHYFVLEYEGNIVGCGGFNFSGNTAIGKISWDIFHPQYQGKTLGTSLLSYRIEKLKTFPDVRSITVRTSGQAYKFYEKSGFQLLRTVKDYWAKGFDLYEMAFIGEKT